RAVAPARAAAPHARPAGRATHRQAAGANRASNRTGDSSAVADSIPANASNPLAPAEPPVMTNGFAVSGRAYGARTEITDAAAAEQANAATTVPSAAGNWADPCVANATPPVTATSTGSMTVASPATRARSSSRPDRPVSRCVAYAEPSLPNWLASTVPASTPANATASASGAPLEPPPVTRSATGTTTPAIVSEIRPARRRGSRHQYRASRAHTAPNRLRGSARNGAGYRLSTTCGPARPAPGAPRLSVPTIADSSVRDHHHSSTATPAAPAASRPSASGHRPADASATATYGAANGVQARTSATFAAWSNRPCWSSGCTSRLSGPQDDARTAIRIAARSRVRRRRSSPANALVTARLATTHTSSPIAAPSRPTKPTNGPPRIVPPTASPRDATSAATAGIPTHAAASMPTATVRRGSGSSANLAGSSVSSTPKYSSGANTQANASAVPRNASTTSDRCRSGSSAAARK